MMDGYDEDLGENPFLQLLKSKYPEFLGKAISEEWTLCVPQRSSVSVFPHVPEDIFVHILVPTETLNHYLTLNDKKVVIKDRILYVQNDASSDSLCDKTEVQSVNILFKETVYDEKKKKYKVICIDQPLGCNRSLLTQHGVSAVNLQSLRDCIYFLWSELGEKLIDDLHSMIQKFKVKNRLIEAEATSRQIELVQQLFTAAVNSILKYVDNNTSMSNTVYFESLKFAIEMYIQHNIYDGLITGISANVSYEDSEFNKIVWSLDDLQLSDLNISQFESCISSALKDISKISQNTNILGKLKCIERSIDIVSKNSSVVLSSDDIIPILVFFIVKTGIPNWIAQLTFIQCFRFSSMAASSSDKHAFLFASFEAAIEYIKSGAAICSDDSSLLGENLDAVKPPECQYISMDNFFNAIRCNDLETVKQALCLSEEKTPSVGNRDLCHPLCSCPKCISVTGLHYSSPNPSINCNDKDGLTPLHIASLHGNVVIMEYLINRNADVNACDFSGSTPLHLAARKGHQNAILLLICSHACVDALDDQLNSALHICCNYGHENCVKAILFYCEFSEISVNINAKNNEGDTPLHNAARWGYVEIVKLLVEHKACIKVANKRKLTANEVTCNPIIIDLIMSSEKDMIPSDYINIDVMGLDVDRNYLKNPFKYPFSDQCLVSEELQSIYLVKRIEKCFRAIERHDIKLVCYYLGISDTEHIGSEQVKELCHPLCNCDKCYDFPDQQTQILGHLKLPINCSNLDEYTPLHMSVLNEDEKLTKVLLENGADMSLKTKNQGMTPLHIVAQKGNLSLAKLLLFYGANPNERDLDGNTCLHYTCIFNHQSLLEIFIDYGSNVQYKNKFGLTPAEEAADRGFHSLFEAISAVKTVSPRF